MLIAANLQAMETTSPILVLLSYGNNKPNNVMGYVLSKESALKYFIQIYIDAVLTDLRRYFYSLGKYFEITDIFCLSIFCL